MSRTESAGKDMKYMKINKVELYYFPDIKSIFLDSQDMKETWGNMWKHIINTS